MYPVLKIRITINVFTPSKEVGSFECLILGKCRVYIIIYIIIENKTTWLKKGVWKKEILSILM